MTILGDRELMLNLERIARGIHEEAGRALIEEGQVQMRESQRRTPIEEGDLRDSHELSPPESRAGVITVTISVGAGLEYAARVHEDLDAHHDDGQAKFLESAVMGARGSMARRLAGEIDMRRLIR